MKNIKWIFFDIGSTLVDESKVYERRLKKISKLANVSEEYVLKKAIEYYKNNKKGDLEVINLLGIEKPEWENQYEMLYKDTETCLKDLNGKYRIGIIANQELGTEKRLIDFGIRQYIDVIVASAEEGFAKPDKKIFEIALNKACCKAEQAVMIGDRVDNDIIPAKEIGMKTIWIKQGMGKYWKVSNEWEKADFVIDSLSELSNIL